MNVAQSGKARHNQLLMDTYNTVGAISNIIPCIKKLSPLWEYTGGKGLQISIKHSSPQHTGHTLFLLRTIPDAVLLLFTKFQL